MQFFRQFFSSTRGIVLMAVLLCLPAVWTGFLGDDYLHYAILGKHFQVAPVQDWSLFGLFTWVDGNPERNRSLMDLGLIPWWTDAGMRYGFWRPLSEVSHWLDHQLWHDSPALMHLHSIALYAMLGGVLARLYRRFGLQGVALPATVAVFMLDSTHGYTVGWISNRNAIIAAIFAALCLHDFIGWREQGLRLYRLRSELWFMLALLSAEIGISTACYLGAYAFTLERAGWRVGLRALWRYALIAAVWWVGYKLGHFGANNSDVNYIDPLESPLVFISKLAERVPVLLASQFGIVPAEIFGFAPDQMHLYLFVAWAYLALVLWMLSPLLKVSALMRFWLLGAVFCVAPISSTIPWDRNLLLVGIGASAVVGMFFEAWRAKRLENPFRRGSGAVFVGMHLLVAPLLLPMVSYTPRVWNTLMGMERGHELPVLSADENVLMVGVPLQTSLAALPVRHFNGDVLPAHAWVIAGEKARYTLERIDETTLDLSCDTGMVQGSEEILRNVSRHPLVVGDRIDLTGLALTVLSVNAGGHPTRLRLSFDSDTLSHSVFILPEGNGWQRKDIPSLGQTVDLFRGANDTLVSATLDN